MIKQQIRIMIVDDHDVVRRGLSVSFKAFPGLTLVGEAANGVEAVERALELKPDVIIMDIMMPEMNGIDAIRAIRSVQPDVKIVALTSFKDDDLVRTALQAGATGYLLKNASVDDLISAVTSAAEGKVTLAPEAARSLVNSIGQTQKPQYNLSERELEVLAQMIKGLTNPEIAEKLTIGRSTVKFHVSSILAKLGVTSRSEAVAVAVENHLVR